MKNKTKKLQIPTAKVDTRKVINYVIYFVLIPISLALGYLFIDNKQVHLVSILLAIMILIPFILRFEGHDHTARELALIAVMVAIGVIGRLIFAPLPGFKPVTAIVIITGVAFGGEAGFITGMLTALLSNVFFGQGPWTPIQMVILGLIGVLAGWLFHDRKDNVILVALYAFISGIIYSLLIDLFWTLVTEPVFNLDRYVAYISTSIPFTIIYMVSNVVFIILLFKPIMKKLNRIKDKFGVFRKVIKQDNYMDTLDEFRN